MAKKQEVAAINLDKDIISGIKDLQQRKTLLNKELAAIGELRIIYKNREAQAQQYFNVNMDLERAIAKEIEEKHGKGTVDIDQGLFFPAQ